MNSKLSPQLKDALEDWRELASDRDAADMLLDFKTLRARHERLRLHVDKLRVEPPQFDETDLDAVLECLTSAQRLRQQIIEANPLDVVVPTLRGFLFNDDETLEEKFDAYPAHLRYAGHAILAELWGWAHVELWPVYHPRAASGLRRLGWEVPKRNYLAFAQAFAELRSIYASGERVARKIPLNLEIDHFLTWANSVLKERKVETATISEPPQTSSHPVEEVAKEEYTPSEVVASLETEEEAAPTPSEPEPIFIERGPVWEVQGIREFGSSYDTPEPIPNSWADRPLALPTAEHLREAEARIRAQLALPADVIRRAAAHLLAGRNLILTGAPGTGKSHLATLLASELFGYYPMLVTATAEWSAFDVVGGLVPLASESGSLRYDVRPGVVYEALRRNWLFDEQDQVQHNNKNEYLRIETAAEGKTWPGVWLIIDELNRADVDKAFGDLFTALESGMLRVPRVGREPSAFIPLPKDFRILATLNTRDRHFLFTLSDALKRRFAFLEINSPHDGAEEQATLLARTLHALNAQGLAANEESLHTALTTLHPIVRLIRTMHPLGSAPLLACLRYIGAAQQLAALPLEELLQEAVSAEILPQLEGLRDLPLRVLAHLFHGNREAAFQGLTDALTHAYGNMAPLRLLRALTTLIAPSLTERVTQLQRASSADPATLTQALALLDDLRPHADKLPAPHWPRVASQLEMWSEERGM